MKHATLYRKWRPRRFSEVIGQEPVVRTLRRAIETERVAHAYLFSGPRGTGKTSTAKVLAMSLNCVKGPTPEPDGTCENCRAIMNNSSLDVVEMDAASNRGIDEIRDLRDRVNLAPVGGRMKVYIIDEVHMLTAEAFNALLKMLEEPPEHVVFVLATTEKHKVLPTIISRCQGFDFRRPGVETLSRKLAEIAEAEGIEVEPEALTVIAREGRGSFRDAEGLLDQLSSFAEGPITASMVRELLGSVGPEALFEATAALHERRTADSLRDRKSTRLNSSHANISYAVFCLKKKNTTITPPPRPPSCRPCCLPTHSSFCSSRTTSSSSPRPDPLSTTIRTPSLPLPSSPLLAS